MLNRIVLMGRLTRDPELRRTQSGTAVTSFSIACDRDFKSQSGEKETDFIDIVAWRGTAEFVSKYFTKGRMAVVEGRLQIRDWTDNNGGKRRSAEVIADNIYFGDSKRDSAPSDYGAPPPYGAPSGRGRPVRGSAEGSVTTSGGKTVCEPAGRASPPALEEEEAKPGADADGCCPAEDACAPLPGTAQAQRHSNAAPIIARTPHSCFGILVNLAFGPRTAHEEPFFRRPTPTVLPEFLPFIHFYFIKNSRFCK